MAKDENDKLTSAAEVSAQFAQDKNSFHDQQEKQLDDVYRLLAGSDSLVQFQEKLNTLDLGDGVAEAMHLTMLDELIKGRAHE
jgi:hypothetical protein